MVTVQRPKAPWSQSPPILANPGDFDLSSLPDAGTREIIVLVMAKIAKSEILRKPGY